MAALRRSRSQTVSPMIGVVGLLAVGGLLSGTALAEEKAPAAAKQVAHKPMDLRPPNITHLFSSEQLNKILAATFREDIEEVQVEGERDQIPDTPTVWPGIAAPIWAVLNPTQAWRIFTPLPPDQTRGSQYLRADATDAYVLEPAGTPSPHAH
ncbi:hypothetical protein [Steroidobacter sp.]|uniref:hypothetical protein n=1 Tax=Steroidobacter sp. TaxID=1978227 RepID=UPI001A43FDE7|nr:hypothetical protein [Steroidobacter sp.]MBL8269140.1 hypothetical protein [Steroidobacter sp.]